MSYDSHCCLCPRDCGANRLKKKGFCGQTETLKVAKAYLHLWEEPCISGRNGSGTVFFSGCNLRCVFCQNHHISQGNKGAPISVERLTQIFLELQMKNAHNINLVSPSHFVPQIVDALKAAKAYGLNIPIIFNSNAYELTRTLKLLEGVVDVYLPDLKYYDEDLAVKYSSAPSYFETATKAILEMYRQVGSPEFDNNGLIKRGLIIRHLVLPGCSDDSKKVLKWISQNLPHDIFISLMAQYTPMYRACHFKEIDRRLTKKEYDVVVDFYLEIGLENGYIQELDSAQETFVPDFDFEGIRAQHDKITDK